MSQPLFSHQFSSRCARVHLLQTVMFNAGPLRIANVVLGMRGMGGTTSVAPGMRPPVFDRVGPVITGHSPAGQNTGCRRRWGYLGGLSSPKSTPISFKPSTTLPRKSGSRRISAKA